MYLLSISSLVVSSSQNFSLVSTSSPIFILASFATPANIFTFNIPFFSMLPNNFLRDDRASPRALVFCMVLLSNVVAASSFSLASSVGTLKVSSSPPSHTGSKVFLMHLVLPISCSPHFTKQIGSDFPNMSALAIPFACMIRNVHSSILSVSSLSFRACKDNPRTPLTFSTLRLLLTLPSAALVRSTSKVFPSPGGLHNFSKGTTTWPRKSPFPKVSMSKISMLSLDPTVSPTS
mmetsp:Transcript_9159/g.18529  ORF Transcript_9159/g.18529 Transcript_9159/m.18529 type:complete len:234 (-) Transcript_9159:4930-5631(-)